MTKIELQKFIEEKSNRQFILKERMELLKTLNEDLSSSKIGRWFGSAYLASKRFLLLFVGIILVLGSVLFFFFPQIIVRDQTVKNDILQVYKTNFTQENGGSLQDKIKEISKNYSDSKSIALAQKIDKSIEDSIQNNAKNKFQFMAILVFIIGIIMFYMANQTQKIKSRNTKILEAEDLTKTIIKDYSLTIKEEDKELQILREYLNTTNP
jgi:predicted PurR-regulated permease PerM